MPIPATRTQLCIAEEFHVSALRKRKRRAAPRGARPRATPAGGERWLRCRDKGAEKAASHARSVPRSARAPTRGSARQNARFAPARARHRKNEGRAAPAQVAPEGRRSMQAGRRPPKRIVRRSRCDAAAARPQAAQARWRTPFHAGRQKTRRSPRARYNRSARRKSPREWLEATTAPRRGHHCCRLARMFAAVSASVPSPMRRWHAR